VNTITNKIYIASEAESKKITAVDGVWRAVWKEGERKKLKSAENETRAPRPRARQIGCAGQFAIPEVIEDVWEVLDFARNYFGSMTLSPLI
jgi:hypothetical protein